MIEELIEIKTISSQELLELPRRWHEEFAKEVGEASYHNQHHISSTKEASDTYLSKFGKDNDPLDLLGSLERWNSERNVNITLDELKEALSWAIECHDLGNIMEEVDLAYGQIEPSYHRDNKYKSDGAEERSKKMAEELIAISDIDDNKKGNLTELVSHLIDGTVYSQHPKSGLQNYMEIMDQVGSHMFTKDMDRLRGLTYEMAAEKPSVPISIDILVNYVNVRLPVLVPDENSRDALLRIWEKKLGVKVDLDKTVTTFGELATRFREEDPALIEAVKNAPENN